MLSSKYVANAKLTLSLLGVLASGLLSLMFAVALLGLCIALSLRDALSSHRKPDPVSRTLNKGQADAVAWQTPGES